jgi:hypothetical protein
MEDLLAILEFNDAAITRHAKLPDLQSDLAGQTREGVKLGQWLRSDAKCIDGRR